MEKNKKLLIKNRWGLNSVTPIISEEIICAFCGKRYDQTDMIGRCCSTECNEKDIAQLQKRKKNKLCAICGATEDVKKTENGSYMCFECFEELDYIAELLKGYSNNNGR